MKKFKKAGKLKIVKICLWCFSIVIFSFFIFGGLLVFKKCGTDPTAWVDYIQSFGIYSGVVLLLLQLFQVFVAIIPGEILEIVSGLIFQPIIACCICYVGLLGATALIFFMMRKLGNRFSRIFISAEKLNSLRFINTNKRLKRTVFLLFLIPGTPKDLLTYFFALTPIKFWDFFVISAFARFPSVVSSVLGGRFIGKGEIKKAVLLFIVTALISAVGMISYETFKSKLNNRKNKINNTITFQYVKDHCGEKSKIRKIKMFLKTKKINTLKIKLLRKKRVFKTIRISKISITPS